MAISAEQLEAEALQLPAPQRARLAERLIASLDEEADHEQAWAEEVQRRLAELQDGQVQAIPAADVLTNARARLA
jgi:putative addiction module component (TIGR02574 family)